MYINYGFELEGTSIEDEELFFTTVLTKALTKKWKNILEKTPQMHIALQQSISSAMVLCNYIFSCLTIILRKHPIFCAAGLCIEKHTISSAIHKEEE